jgi:ACS family pantothenate transporter-like MFS transporter
VIRQNVLLIGAGTSSTDIARELGPVANKIYQSSRNGAFDHPASFLPPNAIRIGEIQSFSAVDEDEIRETQSLNDSPIAGKVTLKSGETLCNIHNVIICTGYHITLPFLASYHEDETPAADASNRVLVTDGTQVHNLHKDIFYIPDPSLAFIGVPYFTATFTLFEFQALAVTAVLSGLASLPAENVMREEYRDRVQRKGTGKVFHSLRGHEVEYVNELLDWINADGESNGAKRIEGHSELWHEAKEEQNERFKLWLVGDAEPHKELFVMEPTCS